MLSIEPEGKEARSSTAIRDGDSEIIEGRKLRLPTHETSRPNVDARPDAAEVLWPGSDAGDHLEWAVGLLQAPEMTLRWGL